MDEMENEKKGFETGAVDYILKPVSPPIVRARINTHLELKMHRDHLEEMGQPADKRAGTDPGSHHYQPCVPCRNPG